MAAHHHLPPRVGDFPFPSLPLSHAQDFTDYFNHPSILFHPHQLLQIMHQATANGGGEEDWTSAAEADIVEESAEGDDNEDMATSAKAGIEDWMLATEAGYDEDLMEDYDADDIVGFVDTPAELVAGILKTGATASEKAEMSGRVCTVCLDEDRTVGVVLRCGHGFHDGCIGEWLRRKNACPCRAIVL